MDQLFSDEPQGQPISQDRGTFVITDHVSPQGPIASFGGDLDRWLWAWRIPCSLVLRRGCAVAWALYRLLSVVTLSSLDSWTLSCAITHVHDAEKLDGTSFIITVSSARESEATKSFTRKQKACGDGVSSRPLICLIILGEMAMSNH